MRWKGLPVHYEMEAERHVLVEKKEKTKVALNPY
jgi:hypothetical protein